MPFVDGLDMIGCGCLSNDTSDLGLDADSEEHVINSSTYIIYLITLCTQQPNIRAGGSGVCTSMLACLRPPR